jgi:hypothetical protein
VFRTSKRRLILCFCLRFRAKVLEFVRLSCTHSRRVHEFFRPQFPHRLCKRGWLSGLSHANTWQRRILIPLRACQVLRPLEKWWPQPGTPPPMPLLLYWGRRCFRRKEFLPDTTTELVSFHFFKSYHVHPSRLASRFRQLHHTLEWWILARIYDYRISYSPHSKPTSSPITNNGERQKSTACTPINAAEFCWQIRWVMGGACSRSSLVYLPGGRLESSRLVRLWWVGRSILA